MCTDKEIQEYHENVKNINDNNILIVEHEGFLIKDGNIDINGRNKQVSDLRYHESWDWLIPVCQKIRDYKTDDVVGGELRLSVVGRITYMDIKMLYKAVVEFIKWYNEKKKK